jgi:hypothetical protein
MFDVANTAGALLRGVINTLRKSKLLADKAAVEALAKDVLSLQD